MWRAYASIQPTPGSRRSGCRARRLPRSTTPGGWPVDTYTIVRRVRVEAETISADPRSRRRRTIDKDQLALALEGTATHAYAVSFIVTNIRPTTGPATHRQCRDDLEVEAWFRRRTDIEDRIREAKLGAALRKLPSGDQSVNTVWMWAALLAGNLSTLLQALTRIDQHGRAHAARLRHELLCVPARLVHHGRRLTCGCHPATTCSPSCSPGSENSAPRPDAAVPPRPPRTRRTVTRNDSGHTDVPNDANTAPTARINRSRSRPTRYSRIGSDPTPTNMASPDTC